ncbi:MAG: hypothetical protein A2350_09620 [Candidatus Raymondbacteria bacterium RifOxyB12_full_50_8]|nr:MAG: hypothetical protein A2350_09620 [Candidatus Raymondbacteria bacterium RifOxyB12_full_50_8]
MKVSKSLISVTCSLACLALLVGCNKNPTNDNWADALDGSASLMATELGSMNAAAFETVDAAGFAKSFVTAETVSIDIIINRHWDAQNGALVRTATASNSYGGSRTRCDTISFYANGNRIMDSASVSFATIDSIYHVRHVIRVRANGVEDEINAAMGVSIIRKGGDTLAIRNGLVQGSWDGTAIGGAIRNRTREVNNLTWRREGGRWGVFPELGTIDIDRPLRTIHIEFSASGDTHTATATVTRKRDDETKTIIVNLTTGQESEG